VTIPGARYFGVPDVATLRQTLKTSAAFSPCGRATGICHARPRTGRVSTTTSNRCRAPCVALQSAAEVPAHDRRRGRVLEGKTVDVRTGLRQRMQQAAGQLDFERAAQVRDALKWLDQLEQPQRSSSWAVATRTR